VYRRYSGGACDPLSLSLRRVVVTVLAAVRFGIGLSSWPLQGTGTCIQLVPYKLTTILRRHEVPSNLETPVVYYKDSWESGSSA